VPHGLQLRFGLRLVGSTQNANNRIGT
jgi:hypothetical protein